MKGVIQNSIKSCENLNEYSKIEQYKHPICDEQHHTNTTYNMKTVSNSLLILDEYPLDVYINLPLSYVTNKHKRSYIQ